MLPPRALGRAEQRGVCSPGQNLVHGTSNLLISPVLIHHYICFVLPPQMPTVNQLSLSLFLWQCIRPSPACLSTTPTPRFTTMNIYFHWCLSSAHSLSRVPDTLSPARCCINLNFLGPRDAQQGQIRDVFFSFSCDRLGSAGEPGTIIRGHHPLALRRSTDREKLQFCARENLAKTRVALRKIESTDPENLAPCPSSYPLLRFSPARSPSHPTLLSFPQHHKRSR